MKFIKVTKKTNGLVVYINTSYITEITVNQFNEVCIHTVDMYVLVRESIEDVLALIGENIKQS